MKNACDLLVIGGGINGTSIARAAAIAGHRTMLVEQGDLAQATSSASTKLMHGGLRYLEHHQFKLVRESLKERAIMLRTAPHIVRPLQFLLPHDPAIRPWAIVRAGLLLYDIMAAGARKGKGGLPRSRSVRMGGGRGFSYWDGRVDDARLVTLNALDAAEAGAMIRTRTQLVGARRVAGGWEAETRDADGARTSIAARAIVNATGPWVADVLGGIFGRAGKAGVRLVRGSHIVLARTPADDRARLLQQPDGRIVFLIPYEGDLTLVGTTDSSVADPGDSAASAQEVAYLLKAANRHLGDSVTEADIVWRYAGIRALYDDGTANPSAVTRDYRLELDGDGAPLLSVFGGKITTARHLAQVALARLGMAAGDTRRRVLPGGDIDDFSTFLAETRRRWPFLGAARSARMALAYGSRIAAVLGDAQAEGDLGRDFGHGLTEREVRYLRETEWARGAEDVLWRRTKLGLRFTPEQAGLLDAHMKGQDA